MSNHPEARNGLRRLVSRVARRVAIGLGLLVSLVSLGLACAPRAQTPRELPRETQRDTRADAPAPRVETRAPRGDAGSGRRATPAVAGFRTRALLEEHYRKHGREFGAITMDEYLRRARALRDREAGGEVLEIVRDDGVITRFDRSTGAFLAFGRSGVIRTFFRPRDGERYFRRQALRSGGR